MDLLKAEIERKRKATAALIDDTNPDGKIGSTRFVRQSDLMQHRAREHAEAQEEMDRKRIKVVSNVAPEKAANITSQQEDSHGGSNSSAATAPKTDYSTLTTHEVKKRLRTGGHPITLFGESNTDRIARLRLIEINAVEDGDFMLTAGHTNAPRAGDHTGAGGSGAGAVEEDDEDEEEEEDKKAGEGTAAKVYDFEPTHFAEDPNLPKRKVIYKYFRYLLKCWEHDLKQRPDNEKNTARGKMDTGTQKQCKDYIRYLFKLCKKNEVPLDIEFKLHLVSFCLYVYSSYIFLKNFLYLSSWLDTARKGIFGLLMMNICKLLLEKQRGLLG